VAFDLQREKDRQRHLRTPEQRATPAVRREGGGKGEPVFACIIREVLETKLRIQEIDYKDNPPQYGDGTVKTVGGIVDAYPLPGMELSDFEEWIYEDTQENNDRLGILQPTMLAYDTGTRILVFQVTKVPKTQHDPDKTVTLYADQN